MIILSLCDSAEVLSVFRVIRIVLIALRIVVPILLVVSLLIEFTQATASNNQDMVKKATGNAIRKCIAAVCVFFIPNILGIVIDMSSEDKLYQTCLNNSTIENITAAYESKAASLVEKAKNNLSNATYQQAKTALKKIKDSSIRDEYERELESLKEVLNAKTLVDIARSTKTQSNYEKAASAVEALEDSEYKDELNADLEEIAASMTSYMADYSSGGEYIQNSLGLPRYDQCDSRWGNIVYDGAGGGPNGSGATFCSSSCGYTSFSMVAAGLNRDVSITPVTVVTKMRNINVAGGGKTYRGYGAASTTELIKYASSFNLKVTTISANVQGIQQALNSNKAVIALVPGHYIVLAPSGNASTAVLLDPFSNWADSRKKSGTYALDYIFGAYGYPSWAAAYSK